jgi:hypothetical protein
MSQPVCPPPTFGAIYGLKVYTSVSILGGAPAGIILHVRVEQSHVATFEHRISWSDEEGQRILFDYAWSKRGQGNVIEVADWLDRNCLSFTSIPEPFRSAIPYAFRTQHPEKWPI